MIFRGNSLTQPSFWAAVTTICPWMDANQWMKWTYEQTNDGWFVMIRDDDEDDKSWDRTSLKNGSPVSGFRGVVVGGIEVLFWEFWDQQLCGFREISHRICLKLLKNILKTLRVSLHSKPVKTKKHTIFKYDHHSYWWIGERYPKFHETTINRRKQNSI